MVAKCVLVTLHVVLAIQLILVMLAVVHTDYEVCDSCKAGDGGSNCKTACTGDASDLGDDCRAVLS